VKKTLLHLFAALSLAMAALPGISLAAPDGGGDYIAMQVPDLHQAVTFFHDVMNCNTLNGRDNASTNDVALLDCGRQTVVELTQAAVTSYRKHDGSTRASFTLNTDDATNIAAWLHTNRIHMVGKPVRITTGADEGKIALNFLTPWGQPLELVSRISADDLLIDDAAPAAAVAAQ
jgi:extradiol dioxygenase family protein